MIDTMSRATRYLVNQPKRTEEIDKRKRKREKQRGFALGGVGPGYGDVSGLSSWRNRVVVAAMGN